MMYRRLSQQERKLLALLIKKSNRTFDPSWKTKMIVRPMKDGGMGSLVLYPDGVFVNGRSYGRFVSDYMFKDKDNVDVLASLYVDKSGKLYELGMWKVNFEPLIAIDI